VLASSGEILLNKSCRFFLYLIGNAVPYLFNLLRDQ